MRKLGIGCVIVATLTIFAISSALWVWSATSGWSNDEGTGIFLTAVFPITPIIFLGWIFSAIGFWLVRRAPLDAPSMPNRRRLMSWGRMLSILALILVGLGVGLPVLAAALGRALQLSTIIESVAALSGALALWALARLCQRLVGPDHA